MNEKTQLKSFDNMHKDYCRFSDRKTSMFTDDGRRQARFLLTMCPAALNARSDGTEVAGMQRYFFDRCERMGYRKELVFHQTSGSLLVLGSEDYLDSSARAFWRLVIVKH